MYRWLTIDVDRYRTRQDVPPDLVNEARLHVGEKKTLDARLRAEYLLPWWGGRNPSGEDKMVSVTELLIL